MRKPVRKFMDLTFSPVNSGLESSAVIVMTYIFIVHPRYWWLGIVVFVAASVATSLGRRLTK